MLIHEQVKIVPNIKIIIYIILISYFIKNHDMLRSSTLQTNMNKNELVNAFLTRTIHSCLNILTFKLAIFE